MIRSPMSMNAAFRPETYTAASPPSVAAGTTSPRSRSTRSAVSSSCGAESGVTKTIATVSSSLNCGSPADATPSRFAHAVIEALRRLLVTVHVDDDRDRPVEARPEAVGEQVVRPPRGLLRGLRSLVGRAEPDERRGRREHEPGEQQDDEDRLVVPRHEPAPARDRRPLPRRLGVVERAQERHLQPVDLVAELRQHGDQQRVRDEHRREDAERRADAELGDEVEPEEREPGHRDGHRQTGEERRAARGRARLGGGVLAVTTPRAEAAGSA